MAVKDIKCFEKRFDFLEAYHKQLLVALPYQDSNFNSFAWAFTPPDYATD